MLPPELYYKIISYVDFRTQFACRLVNKEFEEHAVNCLRSGTDPESVKFFKDKLDWIVGTFLNLGELQADSIVNTPAEKIPLYFAVTEKGSEYCVKLNPEPMMSLLIKFSSKEVFTYKNFQPLVEYSSIIQNSHYYLKQILDKGLDLDNYRQHILLKAALFRVGITSNLETVRLLLDYNINPNCINTLGATPLLSLLIRVDHGGFPYDSYPFYQSEEYQELIKFLVNAGADIDLRDYEGHCCRDYLF